MYAGHFAIGLVLHARYPKVPVVATVVGIGFLDLLDGAGVATGLERMSPAPDQPLGFQLDFIDWDHSLLMAVLWSAVWGALFWKHFAVAFAASLSHWFADVLVHNGDLALYPYSAQHFGFGLWGRFPIGSWFIEGALVAVLALCAWRTLRFSPWVLALLAFLHLGFAPGLSAMPMIAKELPHAYWLHGSIVALAFVVPGWGFVKLLKRRAV